MPGQDSFILRYDRQLRFKPLGPEGQERLGRATVAVVGVGAVGGAAALLLGRAGVGRLILIDHDRVELGNLHRQILYSGRDVLEGLPKAEAAAEVINEANPEVICLVRPEKLSRANAPELLSGAEVVIDGLDNQADRFSLNQACAAKRLDWVQAACTASRANVMLIRPGLTPCFQCLHPDPDKASTEPPTLTHGVIGPAAVTAGSLAATMAMQVLLGLSDEISPGYHQLDLWTMKFKHAALQGAKRDDCPVCGHLD